MPWELNPSPAVPLLSLLKSMMVLQGISVGSFCPLASGSRPCSRGSLHVQTARADSAQERGRARPAAGPSSGPGSWCCRCPLLVLFFRADLLLTALLDRRDPELGVAGLDRSFSSQHDWCQSLGTWCGSLHVASDQFCAGFGLPLLVVPRRGALTIVVHREGVKDHRRSSSKEENKQTTTAGCHQNPSFKIPSAALQFLMPLGDSFPWSARSCLFSSLF